MVFAEFNGTGFAELFSYVNTVTNDTGMPFMMLGIFIGFIIWFRPAGNRRAIVGSSVICSGLSLFLWWADVLPTIWIYGFIVIMAIALALPRTR